VRKKISSNIDWCKKYKYEHLKNIEFDYIFHLGLITQIVYLIFFLI